MLTFHKALSLGRLSISLVEEEGPGFPRVLLLHRPPAGVVDVLLWLSQILPERLPGEVRLLQGVSSNVFGRLIQ